jgi:hypothetical protein
MDGPPALALLGTQSSSSMTTPVCDDSTEETPTTRNAPATGPSANNRNGNGDGNGPSADGCDDGDEVMTYHEAEPPSSMRRPPASCSASPSNLPLKLAPPKPSRAVDLLASESTNDGDNSDSNVSNNNNKRRKTQHDTSTGGTTSTTSAMTEAEFNRSAVFKDDGSMETYFQIVRRASLRRANTNIDYLHDDLMLCILSYLVDSGGK